MNFPHKSTSVVELPNPGGLGSRGGGWQPEAGPESEQAESSLKTAACLHLLPTCMGRHLALHGPEAPSLSFHICPSCPVCSSSPSTPTLKGSRLCLNSSIPETPKSGWSPAPLHMHVTVLCCRILPQAYPPPSVTPHTSLSPFHLLAEITVLLDRCPYLFQKDSSMLFFSKGKKKGKKKTMPTAQRP